MWVASRLWMKFGGKAEACFIELTVIHQIVSPRLQHTIKDVPSAGELGSEIYTVCKAVRICLRYTFLYGCTIGSPIGVVQTTEVICSFLNREAGRIGLSLPLELDADLFRDATCSARASGRRSSGMDFAIRRAQMLSQVWMALAPLKRSPIHINT